MPTNIAAPALIVAALALVGDYSSVTAPRTQKLVSHQQSSSSSISDLRATILKMAQDWVVLDGECAKVVAVLVSRDVFDGEHYLNNMELLKAIRQVEETFRAAEVPEHLLTEHLALRRAIAKVRSRLSTIDAQYRQHFVKPEVFPSEISGKALSALATHTTKQLARLA